ncbi:hypothetical protein [Lacrimispora sp.]|nr:hypothetical protein [Lacrimispora sp.]
MINGRIRYPFKGCKKELGSLIQPRSVKVLKLNGKIVKIRPQIF